MTCRYIDEMLCSDRARSRIHAGVLEHLLACSVCRRFVLLLDQGPHSENISDVLAKILNRIGNDLTPVEPLAPCRALLSTSAVIFLSVVTAGAIPFAMNGWLVLSLVQRIVVFVSIIVGAALLAVSAIGQMSPGHRFGLARARLPIRVVIALLLLIFAAFEPRREDWFISNSFACLKNGLIYSIAAALMFSVLVRRGAFLFPKLTGATVGALAGLAGLAVLEINCSNLNLLHILAGHWAVVLISTSVGAMVGLAIEYLDDLRAQRD